MLKMSQCNDFCLLMLHLFVCFKHLKSDNVKVLKCFKSKFILNATFRLISSGINNPPPHTHTHNLVYMLKYNNVIIIFVITHCLYYKSEGRPWTANYASILTLLPFIGRQLGDKCFAKGNIKIWQEEAGIEPTTLLLQDNYPTCCATVNKNFSNTFLVIRNILDCCWAAEEGAHSAIQERTTAAEMISYVHQHASCISVL